MKKLDPTTTTVHVLNLASKKLKIFSFVMAKSTTEMLANYSALAYCMVGSCFLSSS